MFDYEKQDDHVKRIMAKLKRLPWIRGLLWSIRNLVSLPKYFDNWYSLLNFPSIGILKRYGLKFRFPSIRDLAYDSFVLKENFFDSQYDWLEVEGKAIVDIGANMGDTAILFAARGAKKVYAYEPYLHQFNKARINIALNNMQGKIKLYRVAVSNKEQDIRIKGGYSDGSQSLTLLKDGIRTKTITLSSIIDRYKPKILKCDCEGCEYDIILSTPKERLRSFEQIIIDYHHNGSGDLEKTLHKAGFKTKVREYGDGSGMIKARRVAK